MPFGYVSPAQAMRDKAEYARAVVAERMESPGGPIAPLRQATT